MNTDGQLDKTDLEIKEKTRNFLAFCTELGKERK